MGSVGLSPLASRYGTDSCQSWFWKTHTRVSNQSSNGVVGFGGGNILINNRSAVVEHVMSQTAQNKRGVAFAYCDSRDEDKSKVKNILASLVQQLCRQQDNPDTIDDIFSKFMPHASGSPAWNQLAEILFSIAKSFDESYLLVDALDECSNCGTLASFLEQLGTGPTNSLKLYITSRAENRQNKLRLGRFPSIPLLPEFIRDDMKIFISSEITALTTGGRISFNDDRLKDEIETSLYQKADGM
jgi:hypothetical protein